MKRLRLRRDSTPLDAYLDETEDLVVPPAGPERDRLLVALFVGLEEKPFSTDDAESTLLAVQAKELGFWPRRCERDGEQWHATVVWAAIHCNSLACPTKADAITTALLRALAVYYAATEFAEVRA